MEIKALKDLLPYCLENCTKKTLAVIKAEDDHTLTAVARARKEGAIEAVLIGDAPVIKNLLAQIGEKEEDYHIIDEAGEREALSLINISEPTRRKETSRMPSSA